MEQITKDLEDRSTKLDNLKLVVGTNDIANEPAASNLDGLTDKYKGLFDMASEVATNVQVAGVIPRCCEGESRVTECTVYCIV